MRYYTSNNELPGPNVKANSKQRFHRAQHFSFIGEGDGVAALQLGKAGIGGEPLNYIPRDTFDLADHSKEERHGWADDKQGRPGSGGLPNWVQREKQVLRFYSYFCEGVTEHGVESDRIRRCIIYYYLEDDSLQVVEPPKPNSGIPQGNLVRRHRVPYTYLPSPEGTASSGTGVRPGPWNRTFPRTYITHWDLNVRSSVFIYGRTHRIVDCDVFTRSFLENLGIAVPNTEPEPEDLFTDTRAKIEETRPLRPYKRLQKGYSSEPGGPPLLRFFGRWDDGSSGPSESRHLSIHVYLEDETVEVVELHDTNCGRYKAPLFLKKTKLKKDVSKLVTLPGLETSHTLLNVVRSKGPGRVADAVLIDNLETRPGSVMNFDDTTQFYGIHDFNIGEKIQLNGREVLLYDCDDFTRNYYKSNYKRAMEPLNFRPAAPHPRRSKARQAPHNGLGTEEDSLTSCDGLEPRPPQRDFQKFMHKDRDGFESHILRFSARLIEGDKVETSRKFVISYFLSDDQILINQYPELNTGRTACRFLLKAKICKPSELQRSSDPSEAKLYYTSEDLYVGALVKFHDHTFLITEADDYVFDFMERFEEKEKYPHSNIRLILSLLDSLLDAESVKQLMARFMESDPDDTGNVPERNFRTIVRNFIGFELSEHQLLTLTRAYRSQDLRAQRLPRRQLLSLLQAELKKTHFTTYPEVLKTLQAKDTNATLSLPLSVVRHTLVAACCSVKSNLKGHCMRELIDALLEHEVDRERVDYEILIHELNWSRNPAIPVAPQLIKSNFYENPLQNTEAPIEYRKLIAELEKNKSVDTAKNIEELELH